MTRHRTAFIVTIVMLAAAGSVSGAEQPQLTPEQQAEMEAFTKAGTPGAPHKSLAASAGSYDIKVRSWMDPKAPPIEDTGTATRTMTLDGRVLLEEVNASMMGQPYAGRGMQGYDNTTGQYWTTWNDSMSTGLMVSHGTCDANDACTFTGSWNDPIKKVPVQSRMTTRWTSPTTEVFEMYGPGRDGKDMKMMEIVYTRK